MKMKRIALLLIAVCLFCGLTVLTVSAEECAGGSCGENIVWSLDDQGILTLSGTGDMASYNSWTIPWKNYTSYINEVVIAEGITSITNYAFANCPNLTAVSLPDALTAIPRSAFEYCSNLSSITLPGNLEEIGMYSFDSCVALESITIPASVKYIRQNAFYECTNLSEVTFEEATEVTYGSGLSIAGNAFWRCLGITRIDLPSHLRTISGDAFKGCLNLTGIWADTKQTIYGIEGPKYKTDSRGVLYEYDCTYDYTHQTATFYPYMLSCVPAQLSGDYEIYPTVRSIDGSFYGCSKLTGLTFTKDAGGVSSSDAFTGCTSLVRVTAGAGNEDGWYNDESGALIRDRGSYVSLAFVPANLTEYTIASNITNIASCAFSGGNLTHISVDSGNTAFRSIDGILYNADCTTLIAYPSGSSATELILPASVTELDNISNATNLKDIWITSESLVSMSYSTFNGTSVTVHYPEHVELWEYYLLELNAALFGDVTFVPYREPSIVPPSIQASGITSTGKIKISWAKVEGAVKYEVWRATSQNGTYTKLTTTTGTSVTNSKTDAGTTYYYYVIAVDANGNKSEQSNIVSRTCALAQPVITLSNVASTGKIKVSWEKVEGAVKYEVWRATSKTGTYTKLTTTTGNSVTNSKTDAGKTYYYKVKAIASKSAANSAFSAVKSAMCDLAQPAVTLSNVASTGKIKVSWGKVTGAAKYEVYRATSKSGTYKRVTATTKTSYTDTAATAAKTYYYKVKAVHSKTDANSAFSAVKSLICDLKQPAVTVKLSSKGKPTLDWNDISGATKYKVYIYNSNGKLAQTVTVTSSKYTHSAAAKGKTYSYQVEAICKTTSANSAKSASVKIKSK